MTTRISKFLSVTLLLVTIALTACTALPAAVPTTAAAPTEASPTAAQAMVNVDKDGNTGVNQTALNEALSQIPTGAISDTEAEGLAYMREEEKLARDVYLTLYQKWNLPIFQNIANSEQTHMDAVKALLDRYNLSDPAADKAVGEFTNPKLQDLYNQLVEEGNKSLESVLRVGAAIEEIDILDLEERIAQTDKADIQLVYENLMKGSRNHLRAFTSTLKEQTGATYQPQYLSQDAYDAIVNAPMERGNADAGNAGHGRGGRK
ncbi:MAG: DUF2202 domain-containing protein [Anaerolineae bacterium]|nr:DUF2202 domain-containing protein [Anaerolineae bacterium]